MLLDSPFRSDTRVEKEAISLIALGFKVTVLALTSANDSPTEQRDGIHIVRCIDPEIKSPFHRGFKEHIAHAVDALAQQKPDAVHCHDYHMLRIGATFKAAHTNIPLVYDAHEYLEQWPFYKDSPTLMARIKGYWVWRHEKKAERKHTQLVDQLVTVSSGIARQFTNWKLLPTEPIVIRNIPTAHQFTRNENELKKQFDLPSDSVVMTYCGTLYFTDAQIHEFLDVLASIDNLYLILSGNTPRHEQFKHHVREKGMKQQVISTHYFPKPENRIQFLAQADFGLMHLRSKWVAHRITFSNKFMDYSFAGIPIVSAYQEELSKIASVYNHALFFEEDDPATLKKHLIYMRDHYKEKRPDVEQMKRDLSWENEVKGLLEYYSNLF